MITDIYINLFLKILFIHIDNHKKKFNYLIENISTNYKNISNKFNKNIKLHNMYLVVNKNSNYSCKTYIINNSFYIDNVNYEKELFNNFIKLIKHSKNKYLINDLENNNNDLNNEKIYYDTFHKYFIYKYIYSDKNPYEEVIIYKNNKLERFFSEDSINFKIWKNNYINNLNNINNKYSFKSLLNIDINYFDHEFNIFNIFNIKNKNIKFGDFLKKKWLNNYCEKNINDSKFKYYIITLIHNLINVDIYLKKYYSYNNSDNISKDLNIDTDIIYLTGDLDYKFGTIKDKSIFLINQVGIFIKLLILFLNIINKVIPKKKSNNELRFNNDIDFKDKKYYKFLKINKKIKIYFNKFKSINSKYIIDIDKIKLGLKICLFNRYFSNHLNFYFYNYKDIHNETELNKFYKEVKVINTMFTNDKYYKNLINDFLEYYFMSELFDKLIIDKINII